MRREADFSKILSRPGARLAESPHFTMLKMPAAPALRGLVTDFTLYREHSGRPIRQTETASFVVPLLIGFSDPFEIALGREPDAGDGYVSFTSGLCLKPVEIRSAGACSCLEITLTPLGARRFFGLPMSELTERMVGVAELGDPALERLRQQLGEEPDWARRLQLAERFVASRLAGNAPGCAATQWAYRAIMRTHGALPVARLADRLEWSRKHLAARFRQEIGLPPKAVARVARFIRAQHMALGGGPAGWAEVAAACGYADQAHLSREFRELAGRTPGAWLAAAGLEQFQEEWNRSFARNCDKTMSR